ncbi:MAG: L-threonine 3-dehydrogenase [Clostridiaceae bacterium]|nr:L-threonine 3-dehydrogenase [Clostridiaceae bacterium]
MRRILITGSLGQIGTELTCHFREEYGRDRVIASDLIRKDVPEVIGEGPFEQLDVLDGQRLAAVVRAYDIDTIVHLAAILSATGEEIPQRAFDVNMNGLYKVLEVARENKLSVFTPSSIAAFGASTPPDQTPQDTLQRPNTMYGVTKVAGELLCDYYHHRFGVDTRGVRLPGLISYKTLPGGGTTDYAVHIYYEAISQGRYESYIAAGTKLDMMYMPDCLKAFTMLMEADPSRLRHRNAFNISAMSVSPGEIGAEIKNHIPGFELTYKVDPARQAIADSWPNAMDDSCARQEWDWKPDYDLAAMTADMLAQLQKKGR